MPRILTRLERWKSFSDACRFQSGTFLWETQGMAKRNLRVAKWLGTIPAIGVCTYCNREFKVPLTVMKGVANAQESLRKQFADHECLGLDYGQKTPSKKD
jgi:hypothetical protein